MSGYVSDTAPLDAWRDPRSDTRIAVEKWCAVEPVQGQFVERARSPRMVWNYLRRVGPVAVARKIRSRLAESLRNDKVAGVGIGRVLEAPAGAAVRAGQRVAFFAPNHSTRWPRLVLDSRLVAPVMGAPPRDSASSRGVLPDALRRYAGWSPHSGIAIDAEPVREAMSEVACVDVAESREPATTLPVVDRIERTPRGDGRRSAVVFGLGNYAKTQVVPHVRRHLRLEAVHEIDPDQIAGATSLGVTLDSSPWPRDGERYDAWFIAGFHHTHADLAVRALRDGAYAVVEKPVVTTRAQLAEIRAALAETSGQRLFACFHKRYSRLNEWARHDLAVPSGAPVDMHAIVYEIPLPALHWYNWPASGSRLVSNGCHWLDYFLYMNDFSRVRDYDVQPMRGRDLVARARLDNGAQLVLSLTDTGSQRLGVRDVIDLRVTDVTVRLIDATEYASESSSRVLRRGRVNPMEGYGRMYDTICRRIVRGEPGDVPSSLASTVLMLDLEDLLRQRRVAPVR